MSGATLTGTSGSALSELSETSKFSNVPKGLTGCDPFEVSVSLPTSLFINFASLCIPVATAIISHKKLGANLSRIWIPITLATAASLAINLYARKWMKSQFFLNSTSLLFNQLISAVNADAPQLKEDLEKLKTVFAKSSWQCPGVAEHYEFYAQADRVTQEICNPSNESTTRLVLRTNWFAFLKRVDGQFLIHRPDRSFTFQPVFQFVELSKEYLSDDRITIASSYLHGLTHIPEICQNKPLAVKELSNFAIDEVDRRLNEANFNFSWLKEIASWIIGWRLFNSLDNKLTTLLASYLGKDFAQKKARWEESFKRKEADVLLIEDNFSDKEFFACMAYDTSSKDIINIHALAVDPNIPASLEIKTKMLKTCLVYLASKHSNDRIVQVILRASDIEEQKFYQKNGFTTETTCQNYFKDPAEVGVVYKTRLGNWNFSKYS